MINTLVYVCSGIPSVFDSQVVELLKEIANRAIFKKVILLSGIKNKSEELLMKEKSKNKGFDVISFHSYPNYPFYNCKNRKALEKAFKESSIDLRETLFHVRGEVTAYHLASAMPESVNNILVDIRGASLEEVQEYYSQNKFLKWLKMYNYKKALESVNKYHQISVVSNALKKYLLKNYRAEKKKIVVIPCLAGERFRFSESMRKTKRLELGIEEDAIIFVFSTGGGAQWQNISLVQQIAEKGYEIINLSNKIINHSNVINLFVSYEKMTGFLNAADIAVIWRDKSIVNDVASPVKFGEYLCSGLPIISNNSIDIVVKMVEKYNLGEIIEDIESINDKIINKLFAYDRTNIARIGKELFGIETVASKYIRIYRNIFLSTNNNK